MDIVSYLPPSFQISILSLPSTPFMKKNGKCSSLARPAPVSGFLSCARDAPPESCASAGIPP